MYEIIGESEGVWCPWSRKSSKLWSRIARGAPSPIFFLGLRFAVKRVPYSLLLWTNCALLQPILTPAPLCASSPPPPLCSAAKDGANIVIVAKTDRAGGPLEGTIHTVAEEVVKAGGQALPLKVDLRNAPEVEAAVDAAVKKFGGIDIVINNASALAISPTLETDVKRYDLVSQINSRGTWLTSRLCLPHLLKAKNPHILTLSPPLDMDPKWFKPHCGYTMAKYGMSMVALGLSAEFKEAGVAVNALWPLTTISTAALNILGGDTLKSLSRTDAIMADAAYAILTKPSRECTGNFFIDEDLLRTEGVSDFSKYAVTPGNTQFAADFFVPETGRERYVSAEYQKKYAKVYAAKPSHEQQQKTQLLSAMPTAGSESTAIISPKASTAFVHKLASHHPQLCASSSAGHAAPMVPPASQAPCITGNCSTAAPKMRVSADEAAQALQEFLFSRNEVRTATRCIVQYDLQEAPLAPAIVYTLDLTQQGKPSFFKGKGPIKADCIITAATDDLVRILQDGTDPRDAFTSGRLIVRGNLKIAMYLHGGRFAKL